jgi:hypothetical protein
MTALFGIQPDMLVLPLMYAGIGFLAAAVIAVALSPAIHRRAERLTERRLNKDLPLSVREMRAEKDHLRAQHAMATRALELDLDTLREKTARQGAELGRRTAEANRLRHALAEKSAALAAMERQSADADRTGGHVRADLAAARFEAQAAQTALQEAERAILALQNDIASLQATVDQRTQLIDRQQRDIMQLSAELERIRTAPPAVAPAVVHAAPAAAPVGEDAMAAALVEARPVALTPTTARVSAASLSAFEARLAAIRDDKPAPRKRAKPAVVIAPAPVPLQQTMHGAADIAVPAAEPPAPAAADAEAARPATDIRYDEPLSTADLIELGKAMLRQPAHAGPPHRTH